MKDKIETLICLSLIIGIIFLMGCKEEKLSPHYPSSHVVKQDLGNDSTYYNGEILLPDYAHNDTLIVVNADELNRIFDGVDITILPTTDKEINEALHKYCVNENGDNSDYGLNVDSTGYTIWDGNRLVAHFPFDHNPTLDSIILNDNQ